MTQLASDDFNRANGGLGANWTTTTGENAPEINSNACRANPGAAGTYGARYTATSAPDDQYAEVVLGSNISSVSDEGTGAACRIASGAQTHYLEQTNTSETRLYECVAGSFTQLGSDGSTGTTGDTFRLKCSGSDISVEKNGTTIIGPTTNSSITSGNFGIWSTATPSGVFGDADSWAGGDLTSAATA